MLVTLIAFQQVYPGDRMGASNNRLIKVGGLEMQKANHHVSNWIYSIIHRSLTSNLPPLDSLTLFNIYSLGARYKLLYSTRITLS